MKSQWINKRPIFDFPFQTSTARTYFFMPVSFPKPREMVPRARHIPNMRLIRARPKGMPNFLELEASVGIRTPVNKAGADAQ